MYSLASRQTPKAFLKLVNDCSVVTFFSRARRVEVATCWQNSTRSGIIKVLNRIDLQELPDTYLTDYVSNVFAITPEKVSEITSKYLREEDMTLTVVGDRGMISEQVAPYMETDADKN